MSEEVITIDSDDDDDPPAPGPSSSMGFNPAHYSDLVQVSLDLAGIGIAKNTIGYQTILLTISV